MVDRSPNPSGAEVDILSTQMRAAAQSRIMSAFDINKSTQENYSSPSESACEAYVGDYQDIRRALDCRWHGCYRPDRQLLQDSLIRGVLRLGHAPVQASPRGSKWLIFTCGPMGAGKGYCMNWMFKRKIIPHQNLFHHIDPDAMKRKLPEWNQYLRSNPMTAGSLTHSESATMVEIAQEASLRMGASLWVDGSLSNTEWTLAHMDRIRRDHPEYQIGVFHVTAQEQTIMERCAKRATTTGRVVPPEKIRQSIRGSAETISRLHPPRVDFAAVLCNNEADPVLLSVNGRCVENEWNCISEFFHSSL